MVGGAAGPGSRQKVERQEARPLAARKHRSNGRGRCQCARVCPAQASMRASAGGGRDVVCETVVCRGSVGATEALVNVCLHWPCGVLLGAARARGG